VLAQNLVFAVLAVAMAISALRMVTTKNVVHAALYLVIVLAGVAANYVLLAAEFVAIVQVLVYIGAIIVLFLFGVMLTRSQLGTDDRLDNDQKWVGAAVSIFLLGVISFALWGAFGEQSLDLNNDIARQTVSRTVPVVGGRDGEVQVLPSNTDLVSDAIFSDYLIAFEVSSVLLLAALVGAVVVARRE
jgi:NADH-quinone oxidoreductase subunit J